MSKVTEQPDDYVPTSNFYFDKKNPAPSNFDDLQIDEEVTVKIKGKVTSIRSDSNGKSFEVVTGKVKIDIHNAKPLGIGEAMADVKKERTM